MATTVAPSATTAWGGERVRAAGVAGIVGGVLYVLSYLEGVFPALSEPGTLGNVLLGLLAITAVLLVGVALAGVHARYGAGYGRRAGYGRLGRALVALMGVSLGLMVVGLALNTFAPGLADPAQEGATLGGTVWGLAMFATLFLATAYGVVLWRAGGPRLGAGLLAVNLVLFVAGLFGLTALAPVIGADTTWLAFGAPFGAAWVALGSRLLGEA